MRKPVFCLAVVAVLSFAVAGCNKGAGTGGDSNSSTTDAGQLHGTQLVSATVYCGKCGEVKGSAACCVADATTCECGMHKGSPLCCKELPAQAVGHDLCGQCGQIHEEGHVCAGGEKCSDCGLEKGSPLCCKLAAE